MLRNLAAYFVSIGLAGWTFVTAKASAQDFGEDVSRAVWTQLDSIPQARAAGEAWVRPEQYQGLLVDRQAMSDVLRLAPLEADVVDAKNSSFVMSLPTPDGAFARFRVVESPVMEPGLAIQFPEIKTYVGQGIDDPAATARLDLTPLGFHAQVLSPEGSYYIDPYTKNDWDLCTSYYRRDLVNSHGFACLVDDEGVRRALPTEFLEEAGIRASGGTRRTYRLANACTGEYAAFFGGTVALAQAAIVTAINRVTGVYEIECAVRLTLVANNSSVVFTNSATDPYSNTNGSAMLSQNISTCNSVIGSVNYEVGHVFSTGGGGVAFLGVVCTSSKAGGVAGFSSPVGDPFYIDYVAHEMGHQFGANHNFNATASSCGGGNRNALTAYEPGSGNSIMSYAGICGSSNLQSHSDAYFQHISYDEITAFVASGTGSICDVATSTGNNPPTVNAGADYTIPRQTPFQLTAVASDPDGDAITYQWDQRDLGASQNAVGGVIADNGTSPFIRGWLPTTNPIRTVPRLSNLLANNFIIGEQLPNTNRAVNFRCTVRDNRAGNGGVNFDSMVITSTTSAGPFLVTNPNTAVSWSGIQTVMWNVASTSGSPVNCSDVRILLSTDGGNTWPTVLQASTPNDGSESVTLPNITTSTARIRVEAVGNIFFDISNANFSISPAAPQTPTNAQVSSSPVCPNDSVNLSATVGVNETVDWYNTSCGVSLVGSGNPLAVNPAATTTYYARARNLTTGLVSGSCASVMAVVYQPGDANGDNAVNLLDVDPFVELALDNSIGPICSGDLDDDNDVDGQDVVLFTAAVAP